MVRIDPASSGPGAGVDGRHAHGAQADAGHLECPGCRVLPGRPFGRRKLAPRVAAAWRVWGVGGAAVQGNPPGRRRHQCGGQAAGAGLTPKIQVTPMKLETEQAQRELAKLWLTRFGPATVEDLQWWTGWNKTTVHRAGQHRRRGRRPARRRRDHPGP